MGLEILSTPNIRVKVFQNKLGELTCLPSVLDFFESFKQGPSSRPRNNLLMADTDGAVVRSHKPSFTNLSRISQLKIPGLSRLYCSMRCSTSGDATRGFEPPITPGRIDPVSLIKKKVCNIKIKDRSVGAIFPRNYLIV